MRSSTISSTHTLAGTGKRLNGTFWFQRPFFLSTVLAVFLISGCSHDSLKPTVESVYQKANTLFAQGDYAAALGQYEKLLAKAPKTVDRVLFEIGIIYTYPENNRKDYGRALEYFRKIIDEHPKSAYRRDSQMMMLQIQNVITKDNLIAEQRTQLDAYRRQIDARENEIIALRQRVGTLEQKVFELWTEPVDKVLIEKKERRLTLISNGEAIKIYKISLGGNPVGPKERQGDQKTPEGTYTIVSRNRHSDYHLSLRISYPNEKDVKRAKELGVSPGGDIMIHGMKNGCSWLGGVHTEIDWTNGCIAMTDKEIEEVSRLVHNGTLVEIKP
ncbi:ErfK/YbiS/YcfS/YnhG family protein [Desulfosarcina cetonica]|uniref:L,D-transpeptidase family protein n=1 Tax=Desulfosarcina cetonica TaxID=90730 RepID=UPI001BBF6FEB|nr:L,D-transpeptidase family protein [Desulfosarcina cetonica]VTR68318.1 ErfK/YbiS/YcfS/YnhG family protein [Desulfosarcina cetonica]